MKFNPIEPVYRIYWMHHQQNGGLLSVADSLNSYTSDVHLIAGSVVVCESAHPHTTQFRHSPCSQACTIQPLVQHIALRERA